MVQQFKKKETLILNTMVDLVVKTIFQHFQRRLNFFNFQEQKYSFSTDLLQLWKKTDTGLSKWGLCTSN